MDDAARIWRSGCEATRTQRRCACSGPAPAPLGKLRGEYRAQFLIKGTHRGSAMREAAAAPRSRAGPDWQRRVTGRRRSGQRAVGQRSDRSERSRTSARPIGRLRTMLRRLDAWTVVIESRRRRDRRRREAEHEHDERERAPASMRVRSSGTSSSMVGGCRGPKTTSMPIISTVQTIQLGRETKSARARPRHRQRDLGRAAAEHGVRDVAAVELPDREEVQRRREQAEPRGERDRVQVERVPVRDACPR